MSLRLTFPRLWAALAVLLPVLGSLVANLSSVDLAYHLRAGMDILRLRAIPSTDSWTFTAAASPWLDQQWAAQAILGGVFQATGWTGLVILRSVLVGAIFTCVYLAARSRRLDRRRSAWLTIAAFVVMAAALALRPQLFGMVLFAGTVAIVADREHHPGRLWAVPFIVAAWANLHGSFFLGPLVLGLAALDDVGRRTGRAGRTLLIGAVAAMAALVNPFGIEVWRYALGLTTNAFVTARITEWQPTSLRTGPGILFFVSVVAVVVLIARRTGRTAWATLAWLGTFAAIGAYAIRGLAWWSIGAVPAIADLLATRTAADAPPREQASTLNGLVLVAIAISCVALLPAWRPTDRGTGAPAGVVGDAPSGITEALRSTVVSGDRILNPQPWGSWFELALPAATVAIDSRIEVFPTSVWADFERVRSGGDGWQTILERWGVTVVVATADETPLLQRLRGLGWRIIHQDADGAVLRAPA